MSGYVPLFGSLTSGTLHGRWPDVGLWPIILSLSDRRGIVDVTPQYISGITGLAVAEVIACMKRFCDPDPQSRTKSENGARLRLIDDHRDWGWEIVNHAKYREKARLMAKDAARTESGRDAERKRAARSKAQCPPVSPADPLSDSDSDSNLRGRVGGKTSRAARSTATRLSEDFGLSPERMAVAKAEGLDPQRTFAKFCDHWRAASGANARKHDWDAAWRNWCRSEIDRSRGARTARGPRSDEAAWREAKARATAIGFRDPYPQESVAAYATSIKLEENRGPARPVPGLVALANRMRIPG